MVVGRAVAFSATSHIGHEVPQHGLFATTMCMCACMFVFSRDRYRDGDAHGHTDRDRLEDPFCHFDLVNDSHTDPLAIPYGNRLFLLPCALVGAAHRKWACDPSWHWPRFGHFLQGCVVFEQ